MPFMLICQNIRATERIAGGSLALFISPDDSKLRGQVAISTSLAGKPARRAINLSCGKSGRGGSRHHYSTPRVAACVSWGRAMRCLACGAEMRLKEEVGEETLLVSGFKRHTFQCSVCGDIEQRLAFGRDVEPSRADAVAAMRGSEIPVDPERPLPSEPPLISPWRAAEHEEAVPPSAAFKVCSNLPCNGTPIEPRCDISFFGAQSRHTVCGAQFLHTVHIGAFKRRPLRSKYTTYIAGACRADINIKNNTYPALTWHQRRSQGM